MKQFLDIELNDLKSDLWRSLCTIVRKVDPEAAEWLEQNPPTEPYPFPLTTLYSLQNAFIWRTTPQGWDYWSKLDETLLSRFPSIYPIKKDRYETVP